MSEFRFRVMHSFYMAPRDWWILDGRLETGSHVAAGDEGTLDGNPSLRVTVTATPLICGAKDDLFTICIARPDFPVEKLEGALIIGEHRDEGKNAPSPEGSHRARE